MKKKAVHCPTQEEWDYILSKLPSNHQLSKEGNKFKSYTAIYPEGIAVVYENSTYCGLNYLKKNNYEIITFDEFCKEQRIENPFEKKSLVGRYLKTLVDYPNGGGVKAGEIGIIIKVSSDNNPTYVDFPSQKSYCVEYPLGKRYELMPEGFNPNDVKESEFKVGKWYKSNGDVSGASSYYIKIKSLDKFPDRVDGEGILTEGEYVANYYWNNRDSINQALKLGPLTDLSEIQQYLPDGHPDKIVKPVEIWSVGSYIVFLCERVHGISCIKGDIAEIEENGIYHFRKSTRYALSDKSQYYPKKLQWFATLEEAEQFSKELLSDKTMTKEELLAEARSKYPIGTKYKHSNKDIICIIKKDFKYYEEGNINYGKKFITDGCGGSVWVDGKWAEIVESPKEAKWIPKAGDWVVIIAGDSDTSKKLNGQCVKLKSPINTYGWNLDHKDDIGGGGVWYNDYTRKNEFRKALPHEIPVNSVSSSLPIEGEYYRVDDTDVKFWMIGKVTVSDYGSDTVNKRGKAITINSNKEYQEGVWCYEGPNRIFKPATKEEKEWLNACIEAGKYIPQDKVREILWEKEARQQGVIFDDSIPEIEYVPCENCNGEGRVMQGKLYPTGHHELWVECPDCKGSGVIEELKSEETNMIEIQAQCKKKYPIGCIFKSTNGHKNVLVSDDTVYKIRDNAIYASFEHGFLYDNGKWAEIISLPENKKESFVLPEKWCVKLNNENYDVINKWGRSYFSSITGWGNLSRSSSYVVCEFSKNYCSTSDNAGKYTEITFDQFKEHVLKESRKPEQMSDQELLAEANRRYPIGTKYSEGPFNKDQEVQGPLKIFTTVTSPKYRYITDGYGGSVFNKNGWSKIISLPSRRWGNKEKKPRYIAGIDPYRESDDRVTAMAMAMQSQQNDLRSMSGILASRMGTAGVRYNGVEQIFTNPDDFKWDVIVPQELKTKSITTKLDTHVDRSELRLPEVKQKSKTIKF